MNDEFGSQLPNFPAHGQAKPFPLDLSLGIPNGQGERDSNRKKKFTSCQDEKGEKGPVPSDIEAPRRPPLQISTRELEPRPSAHEFWKLLFGTFIQTVATLSHQTKLSLKVAVLSHRYN